MASNALKKVDDVPVNAKNSFEGLPRRKQKPGDVDMPDEPAALREAMRQHGVPAENMDLYDRIPQWNKQGVRSDRIDVIDANGDLISIRHDFNGHIYKDKKGNPVSYELPHYQGPKPDEVHINYPKGQ